MSSNSISLLWRRLSLLAALHSCTFAKKKWSNVFFSSSRDQQAAHFRLCSAAQQPRKSFSYVADATAVVVVEFRSSRPYELLEKNKWHILLKYSEKIVKSRRVY